MNFLVCVKQVPDTTEIRIDPETNTLIRKGVPSIVNPFDGYALEMAARIKDVRDDVKIVVVSMGPDQAKEALKNCLAVGGDEAYLVSGRKFGGSDTLATSYVLACAIKKIEEIEGKFDVIFCGKQAIDGDTAQVGPELAEHLGIPQITYGLTAEMTDDEIQVTRETEDGQEILGASFPCLVTATKPSFDPRLPKIKDKLAARKKEIHVLGEEDFDIDFTKCGLKGSPTNVKKTFVPPVKTGGEMITGETPEEVAANLAAALDKEGLL